MKSSNEISACIINAGDELDGIRDRIALLRMACEALEMRHRDPIFMELHSIDAHWSAAAIELDKAIELLKGEGA